MDIIPVWRTDLRYWLMAGMPVIERQRLFSGRANDTLITIGLLLVGVWNAPLSPLEKGLYPVAFIICLLGQVLLLRLQNMGG